MYHKRFHYKFLILDLPGIHTKEELKYLTPKDFRSCISSWASEHKNGDIRLNAAALQNHSEAIHQAKYRRNKIKQAMGQSLALMSDLSRLAEEVKL